MEVEIPVESDEWSLGDEFPLEPCGRGRRADNSSETEVSFAG